LIPSHPVMVDADKIVVVASSDDNYAVPLHVLFCSLLHNTSRPDRFELFIIDDGITSEKKQKLTDEVVSLGAQATFLAVDQAAYAGLPTQKHISAAAYYRISIPELFDESVTRAIYLDCDLIIRADLQDLWDVDLDGHAVAAVENISRSAYKKSGLSQADYFNSGVLVLDLAKWREQNISEKFRIFMVEHQELIKFYDQCGLNGVFRGHWVRLAPHWNMQSGIYNNSAQIKRMKEAGDYDKAVWSPSIVHYIGWSKPWRLCFHPLEGEYRRYLEMTIYKGMPLEATPNPNKPGWLKLLKQRRKQRRWQKCYRLRGVDLWQ
jgi:lipopolysaccharide biosynthesis glycosyltransferase